MTTRQTSIDCFNEIKEQGLLSKRRLQVYESIFNYAPCTASEVFNDKNLKTNQSGRFTELRDLGVIYEKGERLCRVTGRNVIEWDLTDRLPVNIKNPNKTKKQRLDAALNSLRELYKNKDNSTDEDWKTVADLIKSI
jgi:cation transport regulator ChaB